MAERPDLASTNPMLAVGHSPHYASIFDSSVVASLCQFLMAGTFMSGSRGNTWKPRSA